MIYGFEWIPEYDRQLHYNNDTYENEYIQFQSNKAFGFEWAKDNDEQKQYNIILFVNKTLILSDGEYKKYNENGWQSVSTILPTAQQFQDEGMEDLSVLDRKIQPVMNSPIQMTNEGVLGEGKVFKGTVDLKKYFDLRKLEVK